MKGTNGKGLISHIIAFGLGVGSVAVLGLAAFEILKPRSISVGFDDEPESRGYFGLQNASGTQGYDEDTTGYNRVFDPATYPILQAARDSGAYLMPYGGTELPNPFDAGNPPISTFPRIGYV